MPNTPTVYAYYPPRGPGGRATFVALPDGYARTFRTLGRGLGEGEETLPVSPANQRRWEAYGLVGAACASAVGIILNFRGYHAAAAAFSVFAALTAATVGAARILSSE